MCLRLRAAETPHRVTEYSRDSRGTYWPSLSGNVSWVWMTTSLDSRKVISIFDDTEVEVDWRKRKRTCLWTPIGSSCKPGTSSTRSYVLTYTYRWGCTSFSCIYDFSTSGLMGRTGRFIEESGGGSPRKTVPWEVEVYGRRPCDVHQEGWIT